MPCLVLADGSTIYDSGIIIEYLQDVAGTDRLLPLKGRDRYRALTLSRLADGIMDASILVVYENRFRPDAATHSPRWLAHQRGKITRGLAAFEKAPPDPKKTDIVAIGLSCALGYLDWRKQVDWRPAYPGLVAWLNAFSKHEPAFERTRAARRMTQHTADTPADPPYWLATPSKPKLTLPAGACDAHVHVFGPRARFPFAEGRRYTPSDAPKEMLFKLHERLGIQHCVIVQPACHGDDNSVTVDAIAATGGSYKGIALVPLSRFGCRTQAARCRRPLRRAFPLHDAPRPGCPESTTSLHSRKRLAAIGWHLQIHMEADLIAELAPALRRSPVPVVIDHMGRIDASLGLDQPAFKALLALLSDNNVWVKVSGADRVTRQGPPYSDAVPFARRLVAEFGDRCVWGTDWPHPNHQGPTPDDGVLVDILSEIAPSEAARKAVLVDNPQRFYRFAPARKLT